MESKRLWIIRFKNGAVICSYDIKENVIRKVKDYEEKHQTEHVHME